MQAQTFHTPVLLQETIQYLNVQAKQWYVDATLGGGGHSEAILKAGGNVLGIDQDKQAIAVALERLRAQFDFDRYKLIHSNFNKLTEILSSEGITPSGVLFDLGVSSFQLGGNQRGFSFGIDEALDMRMNPDSQQVTAADLVNGLYEKELCKLVEKYGEDPLASAIASSIVSARRKQPISTTKQLADLIEKIYRKRYRTLSTTHPATKTFQALRIAVNDEMNVLAESLIQAIDSLSSGGCCVVISFHGLEDKIVKQVFKACQQEAKGNILTKKPIVASYHEVKANRRSRSAKLRAFEKS